jgi:N utilization substance protein B
LNPNQKNRPQSATQAAAGTPRPKSARRRSRELALQGLYEWLISRADVGVVMAHMREQDEHGRCDSAHLDALLQGCISQVAELDGVIAPHLDRGVAQLSPVEHAALRIAAYELIHRPDVPYRVVINEAIDSTKRFGSEHGHTYVNGVLDKAAAALRPAEVAAQRAARSAPRPS